MKHIYKISAILLTLLLAASLMAGCSSEFNSSATASSTAVAPDYADSWSEAGGGYPAEEEAIDGGYVKTEDGAAPNAPVPAAERKLTYTANVSMETKTYRDTVDGITELTQSLGGYIGYSNIEDNNDTAADGIVISRTASFTLYVPTEKLDSFLSQLTSLGNVLSTEKQVADITTSYYDTQSRLDSLLEQEERLLKLEDEAETLDQILQIETQLTSIRYEIEYYNNLMQIYEQEVSMATISLSLKEVVDYTDIEKLNTTLWDDIVKTFEQSFKFMGDIGHSAIIAIVFLLPYLVIVGVILVIVLVGIRLSRKKKMRKAEAQLPPSDTADK